MVFERVYCSFSSVPLVDDIGRVALECNVIYIHEMNKGTGILHCLVYVACGVVNRIVKACGLFDMSREYGIMPSKFSSKCIESYWVDIKGTLAKDTKTHNSNHVVHKIIYNV